MYLYVNILLNPGLLLGMYRKKSKKGKFKIKLNTEFYSPDQTQRKSYIAKKQLQLMSFDFEDYSLIKIDTQKPNHDKSKADECIRTTANSVGKQSVPESNEKLAYRKSIKSRYLTHGFVKGEKYASCRKDQEKGEKVMVNNVNFDSIRLKSRSEVSIRLQQLIRKKRKVTLIKKGQKSGINSERMNQYPFSFYNEQFLPLNKRQNNNFYIFNDGFDVQKSQQRQRICTEANQAQEMRQSVLRPQFYRLISKIKSNDGRKKMLKLNNIKFKCRPN